jgi:hypothetical protein
LAFTRLLDCFLHHEQLGKVVDLVKMAENYGVEAIGTHDAAFIGDQAYIRTAPLARASGLGTATPGETVHRSPANIFNARAAWYKPTRERGCYEND